MKNIAIFIEFHRGKCFLDMIVGSDFESTSRAELNEDFISSLVHSRRTIQNNLNIALFYNNNFQSLCLCGLYQGI